MGLKKVAADLQHQTNYRLEQRFSEMMRRNPHYRNLDSANKALILDLLKRYKEKIRKGIKVSGLSVRRDMYRLYRDRLKLGLTKNDLDQIRDLLTSLKN